MPDQKLVPLVVDLYQGDIVEDWGKVYAAGIRGVILKATEGTAYRDKTYARRRKDAAAAGLLVGAYHFNHSGNVRAQVDNFLAASGDLEGLLLALDWETPPHGDAMSPTEAREFLILIMEKTGRTPDQIYIYGGNVLKERIKSAEDIAFFGQFRLWLCQYAKKAQLPKAWSQYTLWQASADGHAGPFDPKVARGIDGISTPNIDMNLYNGSDLALDWAPGASMMMADNPGITPAGASTLVSIAKTVNASRSLWAIINGWVLGIVAMFTDWLQSAFNWIVGLVTDVTKDIDDSGIVDSAEKLKDWLHLDQTLILKFTICAVAAISIIVFVRHLNDKRKT